MSCSVESKQELSSPSLPATLSEDKNGFFCNQTKIFLYFFYVLLAPLELVGRAVMDFEQGETCQW